MARTVSNIGAQEAQFLWAEGQQESGGNYGDVNSSSGALGYWQVMPGNLPSWLPASGEPVMTPSQFLADHDAQNAVAVHILGGDFQRYGPEGAAAVWYSGQPDPTSNVGNPPVSTYVAQVMARMAGAPADPSVGDTTGGSPATLTAAGPSGVTGAFLNWLTQGLIGHKSDTSVGEIGERAALVVFGALLIIVGIWVLVRDTGAGQSVKARVKAMRP